MHFPVLRSVLKPIFRALLALLALAHPAQLRAQASASATTAAPAALAPGDIVRITVWRRPEFTGDYIVAPDSSITHPLLREVKVAGVPFPVVEDRVRTFLTRFDANPAFVVSPLLRVFVGGEVRVPNVYNVPPGSSVTQLIAIAGGPTERGQLEQVTLTRQQQRETFDLTRADSPGATLEVRSGDQIVVDRRRNVFTEVVVPAASLIAAAAAIVNIFRH
jgi:protein involved in polysaccharide export with SLBB domain